MASPDQLLSLQPPFQFLPAPSRTIHSSRGVFSSLPDDILTRIASSYFTHPNLKSSSLVCRSWRDSLRPLRQAMLFLRWGNWFKHSRGGVRPNLNKALDSFFKGAALCSTLSMIDAGLLYWEIGDKGKAVEMYERAARLGDASATYNLGISLLQEPKRPQEAVNWLAVASMGGNIRAQYQLALCLHQGCGLDSNLGEAARWYLKAAEGGYIRAMYNVALCYSFGEGFQQNCSRARSWMKRAADAGHSKAQYEHGLNLFSRLMEDALSGQGEVMKAGVYLELASRAGERAAIHVKNVILQQLSAPSRDNVMFIADNWHVSPSSH